MAPRLVSLVRLIVLFTVVLGGFAIGSTIYALYLHEHASDALRFARPPAPALPPVRRPRAALEWRDELPDATCTSGQRVREIGPTEAKVDGATLLVGLLWLVGAQADGLHVAAFDAVSLKPQWVAGPYPSVGGEGRMPRHSLTVLDGMVVLGDTDGLLRVLDVRTGEELRTVPVKRRMFHACPDGAAVRLVFEQSSLLFDPATGKVTPGEQVLDVENPWSPPPPVSGVLLRHHRSASGSFAATYRDGAVHVLSLDPGTGATRFDLTLPGGGPATEVPGIWSIGDDVFVRTSTAMLVIDGRRGLLRGRLEAL